jgi:drug/metabolite transporter (DMT)-like permease
MVSFVKETLTRVERFFGENLMQLPKAFYETLPYFYVVTGVATFYHFKHFPGSFFGSLLIFIAGVVFLARSNHREEQIKKKA